MAKFQWFDGNLGFYGYDKLTNYSETGRSVTGMALGYDGVPDPAVFAARIELTYTAYKSYVVEDGPDAGTERVTAGVLTGVRYLDEAGGVLLNISKLSVALPVFLATLARSDAFAAWAMVTHGAATITGSNDASGPGQAGTGDVIDTGAGADKVAALGGDDYLQDRGGADRYDGGTGFDTVSYDGWFFTPALVSRGISADLVLGQITGPEGAVDMVIGVEAVTGTFRADLIKGNALANRFEGFAGSDTLDGRGGFDMVSYGREAGQGGSDGIRVNLSSGTLRDGFGNLDHLISIEGIEGSALRDVFFDNAQDNYFNGGAGNDLLQFGGGNDTGHGAAGADTFVFQGTGFGDDTIDDFSTGQGDHIRFDAATSFGQLQISAVAVDGHQAAFVQFGAGSVTLLGLTAGLLHASDFGF